MTCSYPAHIYRDSGAYSVRFPDIRGCYTFGDTIEDALANAAEVLSLHLEGLLEDGVELPQPSDTVTLTHTGDVYALITCDVDDAVAQQAG